VYMGGVGFQEFFILVFAYIAFRFSQQIKQENQSRLSQALLLLYAEYVVLVLITVSWPIADRPSRNLHSLTVQQVRIIFRLVEYSSGLDSTIPHHEAYQYVFDTLPMFLASVVFNIVHPGRIMPGKESDFPGRKERKNYFRAGSPGNSLDLLPTTQPAGPTSMPEEIAVQPKIQDPAPDYGYAQ
ncbi:MAG: hypothetical protein Q9181_005682, partial [Wetmoreana brouardii]